MRCIEFCTDKRVRCCVSTFYNALECLDSRLRDCFGIRTALVRHMSFASSCGQLVVSKKAARWLFAPHCLSVLPCPSSGTPSFRVSCTCSGRREALASGQKGPHVPGLSKRACLKQLLLVLQYVCSNMLYYALMFHQFCVFCLWLPLLLLLLPHLDDRWVLRELTACNSRARGMEDTGIITPQNECFHAFQT